MSAKLPDNVDIHVGKRVRMQRLVMGMSQEKLAAELGLTFQQVQKYEKGTNRISASRMQQIAKALRVPITFLFEGMPGSKTGAGRDTRQPHISDFLATKDGLALMIAFSEIASPKIRRGIVDLVQGIASKKPS